MDSKELLEVNLERSLTRLGELDPGSDEHRQLANTVSALYSKKIEENDAMVKAANESSKIKAGIFENILGAIGAGLTSAGAVVGLSWILEFEKEGTITSKGYQMVQKWFRH